MGLSAPTTSCAGRWVWPPPRHITPSKEAHGYRPLTDLDAWLRQGTVELQPIVASHNDSPPPQPVPSDAGLNDETLCLMDCTGTASIAAVAVTCSEFGPTCNPDRRRAFWTWWRQEARPAAASRGSLAPR